MDEFACGFTNIEANCGRIYIIWSRNGRIYIDVGNVVWTVKQNQKSGHYFVSQIPNFGNELDEFHKNGFELDEFT
jgi:hypothetical protein